MRTERASGLDAVAFATELLQRVRLEDATAGLWEAADVQWWWRRPRASDALEQVFWVDGSGPLGTVLLTEWDGAWQCDPVVSPSSQEALLPEMWSDALDRMDGLGEVFVAARDDDALTLELLAESGFVPSDDSPDEGFRVTWMSAADRPEPVAIPDGYRLLDRAHATARPHWLASRNGPDVEERLRQCSLYDPSLDLAIETADGEVAAYAVFWNDPVTGVGLVEPMRTEDAHQRRGLARSQLTNGLDRLAMRGAQRLKGGSHDLYTDSGFRLAAETSRTFVSRR